MKIFKWFRMHKRITIHVVKTPTGKLAQCVITENPLLHDGTPEGKIKLQSLLDMMIEKYPAYKGCHIVKLVEE